MPSEITFLDFETPENLEADRPRLVTIKTDNAVARFAAPRVWRR